MPLRGYVFEKEGYGDNLCDKITGKETNFGITFRGFPPITELESGDVVNIPSFPDGLMLCPRVMEGKVDPKPTLQDVPYVDQNEDVLLTELLPESSTFFHELIHLVTLRQVINGEDQSVLDQTCKFLA